MAAQLIDGNAPAKQPRVEAAQRVVALTARGHQLGLAVILAGEDPASQVYVCNKIRACEDNGFLSSLDRYSADLSETDPLGRTDALNRDLCIHDILVQLPLPRHIDSHKVFEAIAPEKDVDGSHVANASVLMVDAPLFRPCTPYGCMRMLESINYPVRGANAVMVGASNIIGKPMAMLLLQVGVTITIRNSKARDLAVHTCGTDIIVAAVGRRNTITADMVKSGVVVIDTGMNRDDAGKLCGDVDFAGVKKVADYITPVLGGVGPMTVTMLLVNTPEVAERAAEGTTLVT